MHLEMIKLYDKFIIKFYYKFLGNVICKNGVILLCISGMLISFFGSIYMYYEGGSFDNLTKIECKCYVKKYYWIFCRESIKWQY